VVESWCLCARFLGVRIFLGFGIYFLGGLRRQLQPVGSCGMRKSTANAEEREGTANAVGAKESAHR